MVVVEGKIVKSDKIFRGRVEIDESGIINKIGEPTGDADFIFRDELIFPGFIDLHVHAREDASHKQDYKEDFVSAGEAAINGGVVAFAEMPNNPIPPVDDASYDVKNKLTKKSPITIVLYAAVGPKTEPLIKLVPYKVFMGQSVGDLFFTSRETLEATLKNYHGQNISFHCEDSKILEENQNQSTHEERRPKEAEILAIDFALKMIEQYNLKGKICHCSTKEGIEKIRDAKKRKLDVVAEVSPHHLYFSAEDGSAYGGDGIIIKEAMKKMLQINPPLRTSADKNYLIEALRDGTIDFLATDHAPHTQEEKFKGVSGTPQLDTYGPFTTWLMHEHAFTPQDIARVCSQNPGDFINNFLPRKYGKIEKGYIGSLTVLDISKPVMITKDILRTKCGWSPFEGITFPGSVYATIIKGKIYAK